MDESERKEFDASLVTAEIQLLFEGNPDLRKAIPDLFCKACSGQGIEGSAKNEDNLPSSATKDGKGDDGDSCKQESDAENEADDGQDEIVGEKSKQRLSKKKSRNAKRRLSKKPQADGARATIMKSMNTQVQSEDSILEQGYDADYEKDSDDDGEDKKSRKAEQKLVLERKTGEKILG